VRCCAPVLAKGREAAVTAEPVHHSARHPDTSSCDRPLLTAIHFRSSNPMQEASIILLSLGPWSSMLYQVNPWTDAMPSDVGERSIISGL
jgi:hypothetical protein